MVRVFANGPGDLSSIAGRVIPKNQKMVLDASLLNTKHYKVEQSWESVLPYTLMILKRESSGHPRLGSLTLLTISMIFFTLAHIEMIFFGWRWIRKGSGLVNVNLFQILIIKIIGH